MGANGTTPDPMTHCSHATPLSPTTTNVTAANAITGPCTSAANSAINTIQNGVVDDLCNQLTTTCAAYLTTSLDQCRSTFRYLPGIMDTSNQPDGMGTPPKQFPVAGPATGTNLQCRRYHVTVARQDAAAAATHCPHAVTGAGQCGSNCEAFCSLVMGACTGTNSQYASPSACMSACGSWPATNATMITGGNSVFCRFYHASVASTSSSNAAQHCPHAGPSQQMDANHPCGGGMSGNSASSLSASVFLVALLGFLALVF
jgi:hypothetical protein